MKLLLIALFSLSIFSCDTEEKVYHYTKYDDEYEGLQEMKSQECIDESDVFAALEETNDFDTASFSVGQIFKITRTADEITNTFFVKITAITSGSPDTMTMVLNGDGTTYDKIINYDGTDNDELLGVFEQASCNPKWEDYWSASGLGSNDSMTLSWKKETIVIADDQGSGDDDDDDDPEEYHKQTDKFTIDNDFPLFFHIYNATYTRESLYDTNTSTTTKSATFSVALIEDTDDDGSYDDEDVCTGNANCVFTGITNDCDVVVNTDAEEEDDYTDATYSYTANSGTCTAIPLLGTI